MLRNNFFLLELYNVIFVFSISSLISIPIYIELYLQNKKHIATDLFYFHQKIQVVI
jgi:Tfp pilus assembly major pilin PilA